MQQRLKATLINHFIVNVLEIEKLTKCKTKEPRMQTPLSKGTVRYGNVQLQSV